MIPDALDVQHQSPCKPCIFFLLPALLLSLPLFLALSVLSFGFAESDSAFSPLSLKDTQASNRPLARAANTDNPCLHPASIHTYLLPALLGAKSTHTLIINLHSPLHCRPDLQPLTSQLVGITSTLTIDTLSSFNMVRSSSAEPAKVTKLKGKSFPLVVLLLLLLLLLLYHHRHCLFPFAFSPQPVDPQSCLYLGEAKMPSNCQFSV